MQGSTLAINGVLKKKTTKLNFQPAQYEKNKFDKDNFWKTIDKKSCGETLWQEKIMWGNTVTIHNVFFFQEKKYKAKLSISSIWKKTKIDRQFWKKKTLWENTVTINSVLKKKL